MLVAFADRQQSLQNLANPTSDDEYLPNEDDLEIEQHDADEEEFMQGKNNVCFDLSASPNVSVSLQLLDRRKSQSTILKQGLLFLIMKMKWRMEQASENGKALTKLSMMES